MREDGTASAIGFSRVLGLPAAVALAASVSFAVALFVLGPEILSLSESGAPLAYALAAILFLPLIASYAERAAEMPAGGGPYEIARANGSATRTFAAGWLLLGGYVPLAALLAAAIAERLAVGVERLFGLELEPPGLVAVVVGAAVVSELLADPGRWRARTAVVWGSVVILAAIVARSFFLQPAGSDSLPSARFVEHSLTGVALLAAGLWGMILVMERRAELRSPERTLRQAPLVAWLTAHLLGLAALTLVLRHPGFLMANWLARLSWSENRLELAALAVAILLCGTALYWTLSSAMRLALAMTRDGFFPAWLGAGRAERGVPVRSLMIFAVATAILAARVATLPLAGMASLTFLWTAVLVLAPQMRRSREDLPARHLPLHPLVPFLAVAGSLYFSLILPAPSVMLGLGWLLIGGLYFLLYARRGSVAVVQRELVVGEPAAAAAEVAYRVLVATGRGDSAASLIRVGDALARARGGELLVLSVVPLVEQVPVHEIREAAEDEWRRLEDFVRGAGVAATTLVRIAPSPAAGIVATAAEHRADFLVLGWPRGDGGAEGSGEAVAERVFRATSRPVAVVHGTVAEPRRVVAATAGGPHAATALGLGDALAAACGAVLTLLNVAARSRPEQEASEALSHTLSKAEPKAAVERKVAVARDAAEGLAREAGDADVLLLGASTDQFLGRTVLGGFSAEVAAAREGPTIVVKSAEKVRRFWLRRLWEMVSNPLPALGTREQAEVYSQMRHMARAGTDYYVQIFLASAIAILGLLLDSGAVIIGAMLVAPLMSPILAMAHGVVQGNLILIRRGGASTAKGIAVAIGVSVAAALALPARLPTQEMLGRGEPNLLDLLVALAAGAAAAYAMSRKNVAPALPGVAISVALVPPLCVVGWGFGASDFRLAGGALLLFATNLAGIVLIGATVFLLLGFRPTRAVRGQRVARGLLLAFVAILMLAIPLGFTTRSTMQAGRLEARLAVRLQQVGADRFDVGDVTVERRGEGFLVSGRIYAYEELPVEKLEEVRRQLEEAVGLPVTIRVTIVEAELAEAGREAAGEAEEPEAEGN